MKANVLLVDDDPAVRTSLARVLESSCYSVIQAANGIEALEQISRQPVDLVLLDLNMPRQNGWDTFEKLTASDPLLPVIVISARPTLLRVPAGSGVGALMEKPLDFRKLLQLISELLAAASKARLARRGGTPMGFDSSRAIGPTRAGRQE